ncbi:MAG: sugar phosphate isomerase/epimerase [Phycisphaeraceae bacterium]|nr:sugar phosphate isomerase/epimerase [Phycisphaeraceae bacterium]
MKPAFSTVACPDWTLTQIAQRAEPWGYLGCELRTFGYGAREFACDPALTAPSKTRGMFARAGLSVCSLATSIRYDEPVTPPLLGHLLDNERMVRESKACVDLAVQLEAPFVRVFGFEIVGSERRASAISRIADRLRMSLDFCRHSGVRLMIENGGSFSTATQLAEVIDKVDHPLLCAAYSLPVGAAAGERAEHAVNVLGERLVCVKVKDLQNGVPCALGEGDLNARAVVEAVAKTGFGGWIVYEFDRAWLPQGDAGDVEHALAASAGKLYDWCGLSRDGRGAVGKSLV